jgi:hypothetical protein
VSWDVAEWRAAVGLGRAGSMRHEIAPPLSAELLAGFRSLRWTYVGPGVTIVVPADRPHFVITLTSSILCSFVNTMSPHRVARCVVYALADLMPVAGTWMDKPGQSMLTVAQMLWYLAEMAETGPLHAVDSRWDALERRVSREEWMKIRDELDGLMVMSPHTYSLPGLRHEKYPARYEASKQAINEWRRLDGMMQSTHVDSVDELCVPYTTTAVHEYAIPDLPNYDAATNHRQRRQHDLPDTGRRAPLEISCDVVK